MVEGSLEILQNESTDPSEFMNLLKIDLYNEEIFVFYSRW